MSAKRQIFRARPGRWVFATVLLLTACFQTAEQERPRLEDFPPGAEQYYYAVEAHGTLCGYAHVVAYPEVVDGREITLLRQKMFLLMSVLGAELNTEIDLVFHIDPATGMYLYSRTEAQQGPSRFLWEARVDDGKARVSSDLGGKDRVVELPSDILLPGPLHFPHLIRAFVERGLEAKTYPVLDVRDARVHEVAYTRLGAETVELAGSTYETVVVDEDHGAGVKLKLWIDTVTGQVVQGDLPNDKRFYLSEPRVVRRIEVASIDEDLTSKVGVRISDFQSITYLKVRAVLRPTGLRLTPEDLNAPGQTFTGTVEQNRVEGVFEIRHPRYDGTDAPPFPPEFDGSGDLRRYLQPAELIESDDPVLIGKARELTAGATDSWQAARRLSTWVAENIDYAIPGGGTARRTYDLRAGECGSHAALVAALCRAVGIPARIVWGCQYIPNYGGAFGQHGWNEVYMGRQAGWVPVDATSFEPDYIDSGHIRIGDHQSAASALNPIEMQLLEYALRGGEVIVPTPGVESKPLEAEADEYADYLGVYTDAGGRSFEVTVDGGALVVDVEGGVPLPMKDPDADGVWWCKLTPQVYVTFDRGEDGAVTTMWFHERARMRKTGEPDKIDRNAPAELRGHLGTYLLAANNTEFLVLWRQGSLAIRDKSTAGLIRFVETPDEGGTWISQATGYRITFQTGTNGKVEGLTLDSAAAFERQ